MTTADLAQAFRDAGDECTYRAMTRAFASMFTREHRETAALAIAEARVREMWRERGYPVALTVRRPTGPFVRFEMGGPGLIYWEFDGHTLADCLHAALQEAQEASNGE